MQALIHATQRGEIAAQVDLVLADRHAAGLAIAQNLNIPTRCVLASESPDRDAHDAAVLAVLRDMDIDWVILAGYMRILTASFVTQWTGRMLNIHPSLLPRYKGLHTHRRVLESGDSEHGTTVHFVTPELDGGPPLLQARFAIQPNDDELRLRQKVQACEHQIYPEAASWLIDARLRWQDGLSTLDGQVLHAPVNRFFDEDFFAAQGIPTT